MRHSKKFAENETYTYDLQEEIKRVKTQMDVAYSNFQNVVDPDLIDCYIYESNAAWKKYRFLLKQAKLL